MDLKDYQAGVSQEHFWFKAKIGLIDLLCKKTALNNAKILSVGAGTGEDLEALAHFGQISAIDIDQTALDMIPPHLIIEKKQADACAIPYPDQTFDMVVAFDVLEHVERDQRMVNELYRVLKPGGYAVLTVPACNALFSGHDKALGHYRRYNKPMMRSLFTQFYEQSLGYWFFFLFFPAALLRIVKKNSTSSTMFPLPKKINTMLFALLQSENWLINKGVTFPFGFSLYGIFKK